MKKTTQIDFHCPQCTNPMVAEKSWIGTIMECPKCKKRFELTNATLEQKLYSDSDFEHSRYHRFEGGYSEKREKRMQIIKLSVKILLALVAVAVGIVVLVKIMTKTPEDLKGNQLYVMTQKRMNRGGASGMQEIVREDFFKIAHTKSDFFYRNVNFINVSLEAAGHEEYRGTVTFTRNSKKEYKRPVYIDRRSSLTRYSFPFKYVDNPEYLQEDGDMIFELAKQVDKKLADWTYVSGSARGSNVLFCTISKGGSQKTIKLKAEQVNCDDGIGRIWVEIIK